VGLESLAECAVRGSGEFPGLIAPWQAGESEGEATHAVVLLCRCRSESRFQTEGPLVSGPGGSQGESRLLVHQPLDVSLTADGALGPVALLPGFRSEQSGSLDTSCTNPPAALWREADLPRESPEPVLRVPSLLHPDIVVVLQGQLGIEADPHRVACALEWTARPSNWIPRGGLTLPPPAQEDRFRLLGVESDSVSCCPLLSRCRRLLQDLADPVLRRALYRPGDVVHER